MTWRGAPVRHDHTNGPWQIGRGRGHEPQPDPFHAAWPGPRRTYSTWWRSHNGVGCPTEQTYTHEHPYTHITNFRCIWAQIQKYRKYSHRPKQTLFLSGSLCAFAPFALASLSSTALKVRETGCCLLSWAYFTMYVRSGLVVACRDYFWTNLIRTLLPWNVNSQTHCVMWLIPVNNNCPSTCNFLAVNYMEDTRMWHFIHCPLQNPFHWVRLFLIIVH